MICLQEILKTDLIHGGMKLLDWIKDKQWSDKFLPEIKSILGLYLIGEPKDEEDIIRNTDLIVLKMEAVRIACRIRKSHQYNDKYMQEFTIRYGRPSGNKTELTKIIEGWGNYLFYGFSDDTETSLRFWSLFDLGIFRLWYNRELFNLNKGEHPGTKINNHDNSSSFMVFNYKNFPKDFVVGQKSATQRCSATK